MSQTLHKWKADILTHLLLWGELVVAAAVCLKQGTGKPLQELL